MPLHGGLRAEKESPLQLAVKLNARLNAQRGGPTAC